jgi:E3 ubiquitin-protein ligase MYCBP2
MHNASLNARSLASDGQFLYLYTSKGLFKIGSGFGGTIKGHVYLHKADFHVDDRGWLGYANVRNSHLCCSLPGNIFFYDL